MAASHHDHGVLVIIIFFFLVILISTSQTSAARGVRGLPVDINDIISMEPIHRSLLTAGEGNSFRHVGCSGFTAATAAGSTPNEQKVAGKYGPLLFSLLPRGFVPPSGPSKGTNEVNT